MPDPDSGPAGEQSECRAELESCRQELVVQVRARRAAEWERDVALGSVQILSTEVAALMSGAASAAEVGRVADRAASWRVALLRAADDIDAGVPVRAEWLRRVADR